MTGVELTEEQSKLREESDHHRKSHLSLLLECEALRTEVSRLTASVSEGEASTTSLEERTAALAQLNREMAVENERLENELALAHTTLAGVVVICGLSASSQTPRIIEKMAMIETLGLRIRDHESQYAFDQGKMKEVLQDIAALRAAERQRDDHHASELASLQRTNERLLAENASNAELLRRLEELLLSRHTVDAPSDSYSIYDHLLSFTKHTEGAISKARAEIESLTMNLQGKRWPTL